MLLMEQQKTGRPCRVFIKYKVILRRSVIKGTSAWCLAPLLAVVTGGRAAPRQGWRRCLPRLASPPLAFNWLAVFVKVKRGAWRKGLRWPSLGTAGTLLLYRFTCVNISDAHLKGRNPPGGPFRPGVVFSRLTSEEYGLNCCQSSREVGFSAI